MTTSRVANDATITIHREDYPGDTLHFNLPMVRTDFRPSTLQAIADDIASARSRGSNYKLTAVRNGDGSFTLQ